MTSHTVPLAPSRQPLLLPGAPGPATLVEHVFATRTGLYRLTGAMFLTNIVRCIPV
ncbi:hypothetical protein ABZ362_31800 [Streptomyces sp. NPDC005951]|uniref:hypothetical protein n=1 Tax=Streptomyces sp. NPDC005951 TaxID=3154573 RepID=UPI0033D59CEA